MSDFQFTKKSATGLRKETRNALRKEIAEIDKLVSEILGL